MNSSNNFSLTKSKIYVAGHRGLAGSAIVRRLQRDGCQSIITMTRGELDLRDQGAVDIFFRDVRPDYVFLAAAKVGGILANNIYPEISFRRISRYSKTPSELHGDQE